MNTDLLQKVTRFYSVWGRHFVGDIIGGVVRDILYNRPAKDIDIFIQSDPEGVKSYLRGRAREAVSEGHWAHPFEYFRTQRDNVSNFTLVAETQFEDIKVQVISSRLRGTLAIMNEFDWNVCQYSMITDHAVPERSVINTVLGGFVGTAETCLSVRDAVSHLPTRLVCLNMDKAVKTLYRGLKFQDKLGLPIDKPSLVDLLTAAKVQAAAAPIYHCMDGDIQPAASWPGDGNVAYVRQANDSSVDAYTEDGGLILVGDRNYD